MAARIKRLQRELDNISHFDNLFSSVRPIENNLSIWACTIKTDIDSDYDGQVYTLEIQIPQNYPFHPPRVRFTTPIHHPCVGHDGYISLDILGAGWSPAFTIPALGMGICSLLNTSDIDYSKSRQNKRVRLFKNELISRLMINDS